MTTVLVCNRPSDMVIYFTAVTSSSSEDRAAPRTCFRIAGTQQFSEATVMKRVFAICSALLVVLSLAAALGADVKTREKTIFKLEGFLGRFVSSPKEGVTSTVALKGNRLARVGDATGQIIDLTEQKIYDLDVKKKEYKVTTFEELRKRLQEARANADKQMQSMPAEEKSNAEQAGKQIEFDVDVKETGQRKNIAGHDTREVILTITGHEKDKKVEESGGFIMTNTMWLGPRVAAMDEIGAFHMKYFQAVYGEALGIDPQQTAALASMFPSFSKMAQQMAAEGKKLQGTSLASTMTFESMKSAAEMSGAGQQQSGGGGISGRLGGMLARRMRGPAQQRNLVMTSSTEYLSIETSASEADVAIPAGFKEKK
jgi:hypothetical protein